MTPWARILYSPVTRRTSSYFSSKAGGGRYFNSAKPLSAPTAPKKTSNSPRAETGPNDSPSQTLKAVEESSSVYRDNFTRLAVPEFVPSTHPVIGDKDFKLHQFFSLHRPLLLLSNPQSILHSSPPASISSLPNPPVTPVLPSTEVSPEFAVASDAEAARTLARALAINRAGATFVWEETLKHIGLDVSLEPGRVGLQERLDKELKEVRMDSTRRKRRKKMKKHKLKKRRRLTRAQRLKMR
ncbi:hypothetical protein EV361DRAFT_181645 [Lentinula raphanica]|nr:hypothetical protein C8R42DRAFT_659080 [Lentinula raphanica]KAJ3819978.1 hypothetical protein F5880DRAFT_1021596 [Lentinula raphanica]KAJ3971905.1 hypothetical protein EV361DRAFT_181645 [Lentinula raphanica]